MILYHYTCIEHLKKILEDKMIKLTASNLLKPIDPKIINGVFSDSTDSFKPVVWFTTIDDFEKAADCGLKGGMFDKTEAAIVIDTSGPVMFYKWDQWAIRNNIDRKWFENLKEAAPQWESFYISETPIPITNNVRISFRPDIMKMFEKDMKTRK